MDEKTSGPPPSDEDGAPERSTGDTVGHSRWSVLGIPMWCFLPMLAVLLTAAYTETLPSNLISGFAISMAVGLILMWIGGQVPVLKDFGLPILLALFMPAVFVWQGLVPEPTVAALEAFIDEQGAWDFILVSIIVGAMLGMPRKLIIKAGLRFAVPVVGTIVIVFALVGALGAVLGYGFGPAIFFVAGPVLAGGLPIGAIPMSEMYAHQSGGASGDYLSLLISAVLIANVFCVVFAAVLNGLGKRADSSNLWFSGHGQLLRVQGDTSELETPPKPFGTSFVALGQGLLIAGTLYVVAVMFNTVVSSIHEYAWLTFIAAAIKIAGFVPQEIEDAAARWGDFATGTLIPVLLVSVSATSIDIGAVVAGFTDITYVTLIIAAVVFAMIVAGVIGYLVKFYALEASIVPGLIMADTGGSGDVAVLSAAERMHLLPFATVATRLGGALVLVLTSALLPVLGPGVF